MYRRIMVPLDGSDEAEQALAVADQLARLYRRPAVLGCVCIHLVRVLHTVPPVPWGPYPYGILSMPEALVKCETAAAAAYLGRVQRRLSAAGL